MRTVFDVSPLYRSTVGFDRVFDMFDRLAQAEPRSDWPPYNIERTGETQYRISIALAGFSPEEVEIVQQENVLQVTGQKHPAQDNAQVLHRGIAGRSFKLAFNLADHMKVTEARVENGLLVVDLVLEVPEAAKPRRIQIAGSTGGQQALGEQKQLGTANAA